MNTTSDPKKIVASGCIALVAAAQALLGQSESSLPEAWSHWRYSAVIEVQAGTSGLTAVQLMSPVSAHTEQRWQDLRIVDDAGRETPFVVHARLDTSSVAVRPSRLLEVTFAPGESTQGIVDLGEDPAEHNAVEIAVNEREYFLWVTVAISPDARAWRILNERSPIYRFSSNNLDGNQTVRYSPTRARYLRVRLLEGNRKLPLDGVRVTHVVRRDAERTRVDLDLAPDPASPANQSWWRVDAGDSRLPVSELRVEAAQPEFHRAVRVSVSDDGQQWRTAGQGDVFRLSPGRPGAVIAEEERERLRVRFSETRARYWRVEVFNRSDPPLPGLKINLFGTPRRAVFRAEPGRRYRLVFGNARAHAAQYELARLTPEADLESARSATLGLVVANPNWVDPAPWSERHPVVLWAAVIAAAAALGALALQALRGSASSSRETDA